jgi:hypothetical protein
LSDLLVKQKKQKLQKKMVEHKRKNTTAIKLKNACKKIKINFYAKEEGLSPKK